MPKEKICEHCKEPIELANPSGYCNHVHYPEGCKVCDEHINGKPEKTITLKWLKKYCKENLVIGLSEEDVFDACSNSAGMALGEEDMATPPMEKFVRVKDLLSVVSKKTGVKQK